MKNKILVRFAGSMMSIDEAMKTVVELDNDYNVIIDYVKKEFYYLKPSNVNITVRYHCYDRRINWSTYLLCVGGHAALFIKNKPNGFEIKEK